GLHRRAARLYAEAFARDPKVAEDAEALRRYSAASAAALAAARKGKDADKLDGKEKARLRGQALGWLKADLTLWRRRLDAGKPAARAAARMILGHWRADPDLAGVRDKAALAKLPEAERAGWGKLWAGVDYLLGKAQDKPGKR